MIVAGVVIVILIVLIYDKSETIKYQRQKIKKLEKYIKELEEKRSIEENVVEKSSKNLEVNKEQIDNGVDEASIEKKVIAEGSDKLDDLSYNSENVAKNFSGTNSNKSSYSKVKTKEASIDRKNNNILLTGSILIVLAAIVFLTSTWYTIPNILKTAVLVLFIGIFLGISKFAKEKFNLEKTSKTFFYIAMAYIPICLIGISFFGLFGEYLSIRGNGRGIYLALVSTFLALLYYRIYKAGESKGLLVSSVVAQCSAVVAFATIIETRFDLVCILLLLYNLVLILVTKDKLMVILQRVILYSTAVIFSLCMIILDIFNLYDILDILVLLLLSVNFMMMSKKYKWDLDFVLFNIFSIGVGNLIISYEKLNIDNNFQIYLQLLWIIAIYFFTSVVVQDKKKIRITTVISLLTITIMGMTLANSVFLKFYMFIIVDAIILTVSYIRNIFSKEFMNIALPGSYILALELIAIEYDMGTFAYVIFAMLAWGLSMLIKDEKLRYSSFIISHIAIIISELNMIGSYSNELIGIILIVALIPIYYVSYKRTNKNPIYKYGAYISFILSFWSIDKFLDLNFTFYIFAFSSIIMSLIEISLRDKLEDKYSENFILGMFGISYVSLLLDVNLYSVFLAVILCVILLTINYFYKKENKYNLLALIGGSIVILAFNNQYLNLIIGLILTLLSLSNVNRKYEFTIASFIYLSYFGMNFDIAIISYFIMLVWSISHLLLKESKNDVFVILSYVFSYMLYREILIKLGLDIYVSAKLIGLEVLGLFLFRTNFKNKEIDLISLKWIFYIILYLWAIGFYYNIADGMISVGIMIAMVIVSYTQKDGKLVLINLVSIIINVFGLTKEFWLSVPWWIYLLVVGFVLIGFAVMNEAREKDKKINYEYVKKVIKDKFDTK